MFCIGFAQELAGDLILTFYKTEGAFTQVVGDGDGESSDSVCIVVLVFPEPGQENIFIVAVIRIEILDIFPVSGFL